jgi:hypothetical protein
MFLQALFNRFGLNVNKVPQALAASTTNNFTGNLTVLSRQLSSTSVMSLLGSHPNISLNGTTLQVTSALGDSAADVLVVREQDGNFAMEYPVNITTPAPVPVVGTIPAPVVMRPTGPVGMNVGGTGYYGVNFLFLDRMKTANWWSSTNNNGKAVMNFDSNNNPYPAPPQTDSDNYPTVLNQGNPYYTLVNVDGPLSGVAQIYILECANTTVNFSIGGGGTIVHREPTTGGKQRITIDATNAINDQGYYFSLYVDAPLSGTPVTIFRQDQETLFKAGNVFTPETLSRLNQFGTIRFMDWLSTNGTIAPVWADRVKVSSLNYYVTPLEICILLCNLLKVDGWFCIPAGASDDYITQFVTLIETTLDPSLRAYYEYSNEMWNSGFGQYGWLQYTYQPPVDLSKGGWPAFVRGGFLSARAMALVLKTANFSARTRPLLMGQAGYNAVLDVFNNGVNYAIADWSDPTSARYDSVFATRCQVFNQIYSGIGVAGYFDGSLGDDSMTPADKAKVESWANATDDSGKAAAFRQVEFGDQLTVNSNALVNYPAIFAGLADRAQAWQVPILGYEGGFDLISMGVWKDAHDVKNNDGTVTHVPTDPNQSLITNFFQALTVDPRAQAITHKWVNAMRQLDFSLICQYNDVGSNASKYGIWGSMTDAYHPNCPKQLGLLDAIANPVNLPPISISTAYNGATAVGSNPTMTITTTGGVGKVVLTVTGLAAGRVFNNCRSVTGVYTQQQTTNIVITATDDSGNSPTVITVAETVTPTRIVPGGYVGFRLTPSVNLNGNKPGDQYWTIGIGEIFLMTDGVPTYLQDWILTTDYGNGNQQNISTIHDGNLTTSWTSNTGGGGTTFKLMAPLGTSVLPSYLGIGNQNQVYLWNIATFGLVEGTKDGTTWSPIATNVSLTYNADGVASIPVVLPDYTVTAPVNQMTLGTTSGNFTVTLNTTSSTATTLTPSDNGAGGTFTPASVVIPAGSTSATFTYLPVSASMAIKVHNNRNLINPDAITTVAYTTDAPVLTASASTPANANSASTTTVQLSVTAGELIFVGHAFVSGDTASVTDTAGNSYTVLPTTNDGNGTSIGAAYTVAQSTATLTITWALTGASTYRTLIACAYTGSCTTFDSTVTSVAPGQVTMQQTGKFSTTQNSQLVLGVAEAPPNVTVSSPLSAIQSVGYAALFGGVVAAPVTDKVVNIGVAYNNYGATRVVVFKRASH